METQQRTESDDDEAGAKLIPEWGVRADDQIVLAGLAVLAALLLWFGWNAWRGGDDDVIASTSSLVSPSTAVAADDGGGVPAIAAPVTTEAPTTTEAAPTTTEAPTTTAAAATIGDVQAAVDPLAGNITGTNDGAVAVLEGFVANQGESDEAETAAAAVEGIESVTNNLVLLEPPARDALVEAGVVGESAQGVGTTMRVAGTLASEDDRAPTIAAVEAIEGITAVEDELVVSVAADLNELPQVQFATASAEILPASFADLDEAAELIISAGEVQLLIVGWTDTRGDEAENLALSQARAEAVAAYLIEAGVPGGQLASVGNGETDQFAEGDSAEALAANRVVLFEQTG